MNHLIIKYKALNSSNISPELLFQISINGFVDKIIVAIQNLQVKIKEKLKKKIKYNKKRLAIKISVKIT